MVNGWLNSCIRILRALARKLVEKGLGGELAALREIGDRLDGKPAQTIERGDVPVEALSDAELFAIIRDGSRRQRNEPALICGAVPPTK
jgi:hypothetical protein